MAGRSTRQKILDQAQSMIVSCQDIVHHLRNLSDLADGRSEIITVYTPLLLQIQTDLLKILIEFRSQL